MLTCIIKKSIAICLIGLGIGVLLVLLLPITWWLFLIGISVIMFGIILLKD